jgi:hypothetical protein
MIEISADHPHDDDDAMPNLNAAYTNLLRGLEASVLPAETLKKLGDDFSRAAGLDRLASDWGLISPQHFLPQHEIESDLLNPAILSQHVDTSHHETARNTERMAESLEAQHAAVAQLVRLTASSLALTTEQREASERSERFSRRTTITSVVIGAIVVN